MTSQFNLFPFNESTQVNDTKQMREVLEKIYAFCIQPTDVENANGIVISDCYIYQMLGLYLKPIFKGVQTISMEKLFKKYGTEITKNMDGTISTSDNAVISSSEDYDNILRLYNAGLAMNALIYKNPLWAKKKDGTGIEISHNLDTTKNSPELQIINAAEQIYEEILEVLEYFHYQPYEIDPDDIGY